MNALEYNKHFKSRLHKKAKRSKAAFIVILLPSVLSIVALVYYISPYTLPKINTHLSTLNKILVDQIAIKNVNITGNVLLTCNEIVNYLNLNESFSFILPLDIQKKLEEHPYIASANAQLLLPNTLKIDIVERVPDAVWWNGEKFLLIDANGFVLEQHLDSEHDKNSYLAVAGDGANTRFKEVIDALKSSTIYSDIKSVVFISKRRWDVTLTNGTLIKLPEKNIPAATLILGKLLKQIPNDKGIDSIDLRCIPDKVYIKYNDKTT